jgi:hypothetical protein
MENKNNNYGLTRLLSFRQKKPVNRTSSSISLIVAIIFAITLCQFSLGSISASPVNSVAEQQFNLDATYAYVGKGISNDNITNAQGIVLSPISQYPSAVYFNVTRPTAENDVCDALLEVFNVTIASDKGPAEHFVFFTGTNNNPSFSDAQLNTLTEGIYDLFDVNDVDGVSGMFCYNWTNDESYLSAKVGSYGTYTNYKNGLGLWSAGQPNTISVTFHRIGYVTITNGAVSAQPDVTGVNSKTQVPLQKYGDDFLRNEIVPMDKLPQENWFEPRK